MNSSALAPSSWLPLGQLHGRFESNLAALATREPMLAQQLRALQPAADYRLASHEGVLLLGSADKGRVNPLPVKLSPKAARDLSLKLFDGGGCTQPAMIVGEDLGWLWNSVYSLPCNVPLLPMYRPPLYFLIADLQQLRVILHVQSWSTLLGDPRVRLFAGPDAVEQLRESMVARTDCAWPMRQILVDPQLWPPSLTIDTVIEVARARSATRLAELLGQMEQLDRAFDPEAFIAKAAQTGGAKLRILGITSRYTTFLQHSMRDWLAACETLGHETQLMIEAHDHETFLRNHLPQVVANFQPDLVLGIDHSRKSFHNLPAQLPVVMWVQDELPHIFHAGAGAAQTRRDYTLGFARTRLVHQFGYPADRFLPAAVGVNEQRFAPRVLSTEQRRTFGCEVAFVSHASTPAEQILETEIAKANNVHNERLLRAIFEQLTAVYQTGGMVSEPILIDRMIDRAKTDTHVHVTDEQLPALINLFTHRINNALFRHQSLHWLAAMDVDLHLYGNGWEDHPTLKRFARGPAGNQDQLGLIYQASAINLQIGPNGACHQRVFEGLCSGAFFMLRYVPGDVVERHFRVVQDFVRARGIRSDAELRQCATPQIQAELAAIADNQQASPFDGDGSFVDLLEARERAGYTSSAGTVWGDDYDAVTWNSAQQLEQRVQHFLGHADDRAALACRMREAVLSRFTYRAITENLLELIVNDFRKQRSVSSPTLLAA